MTRYVWEKLAEQSETGFLTAELSRGFCTLMCRLPKGAAVCILVGLILFPQSDLHIQYIGEHE